MTTLEQHLGDHEFRPQSTKWSEPYGECACGHNEAQDGAWKPYDVGNWAKHVTDTWHEARTVTTVEQALAPIRELHKPDRFAIAESRRAYCTGCELPWPCDTARHVYATEELNDE